jgi:hypothetical protein
MQGGGRNKGTLRDGTLGSAYVAREEGPDGAAAAHAAAAAAARKVFRVELSSSSSSEDEGGKKRKKKSKKKSKDKKKDRHKDHHKERASAGGRAERVAQRETEREREEREDRELLAAAQKRHKRDRDRIDEVNPHHKISLHDLWKENKPSAAASAAAPAASAVMFFDRLGVWERERALQLPNLLLIQYLIYYQY